MSLKLLQRLGFLGLLALLNAAPLWADIPFFWLDKPSGRTNPHDPRNPLFAVPTLPVAPANTATPTPTAAAVAPSATLTPTPQGSATPVLASPTSPASFSASPSPSPLPDTATCTATPAATAPDTATSTFTPMASPSQTPSGTPLATLTATPSTTGTDSPTLTFTDVPLGSTLTDSPTETPVLSPTDSPSPTPFLSDTATPSSTPTATAVPPTSTRTATPTSTPSRTLTESPTLSPTRTVTPSFTASPTATAVSLSTILYDGDTAGATLADGVVTNNESATTATGTLTQVTGGNPGNMMRLNYAGQTGYWQSHKWVRTTPINIGANDYLQFEVRQDPASPAVTVFKMVINWTTTPSGLDVATYLVTGSAIDTTWRTVRIPLSALIGVGQTAIDAISFINNSQNTAYTVNIDNLKLITSVPTATPTVTQTLNPAWTFTATPTTGTGFVHPGAWSSAAELAHVKANIASQPYAARLANLGNLARTPNYAALSVANIINACNGDANLGQDDSMAAYAQAVAWAVTGNVTYANRSIAILNAWSGLQSIQSTACWVDQKTLDAGWFGADFANAAEIMRGYSGWTAPQIAAFQAMLKRAFYPLVNTMSTGNGNVDLTQIDAMMSMAVFCDDLPEYNAGIARLAARVPSYIHLSGGAASIPAIAGDGGNVAGFYSNPTSWLPGVEQETCRDNGHHVQFALGSAIHAAEIAWHQGTDLYTTHQARFTAALELLSLQITSGNMQGTCSDNVTLSTTGGLADTYNTFEIGYNHYVTRKGGSLPNTLLLITNRFRPAAPSPSVHWEMLNLMDETLTHAGVN